MMVKMEIEKMLWEYNNKTTDKTAVVFAVMAERKTLVYDERLGKCRIIFEGGQYNLQKVGGDTWYPYMDTRELKRHLIAADYRNKKILQECQELVKALVAVQKYER
jgi:hypothetical protein